MLTGLGTVVLGFCPDPGSPANLDPLKKCRGPWRESICSRNEVRMMYDLQRGADVPLVRDGCPVTPCTWTMNTTPA